MNSIQRILRAVRFASLLSGLIAISLLATAVAASKHTNKRATASRGDRRSSRTPNRKMTRRELASQSRRGAKGRRESKSARRRRELAEARRRAAALARQRALDEAMRNRVGSMIAKDDIAGEDPEVRRVALNALGNHAGTVVVMDPKTGRVYSIVNQEWALGEGFKPCSTIKLVTGLAGLNEKLIDPNNTRIASGAIDLTAALAHSNNPYFQQVGGRVGFDKMLSYARELGLGEKTGINARNEFQGELPMFKSGAAVNHMSSHGDDFKVTAVQLATLVSAMANGGKLLTPYIARPEQQETGFKPIVRRTVNIDQATWQYMVPGMVGAVNYGSGRKAYDPNETVAGKTGTCIGEGGWVGLFASYAPLANPRLAIVVIARGTDAHSHFPAAVAGKIYRDLNGRFGTPVNMQFATRSDSNTPANGAASDGTKQAALNAGDDEDSEEAAESAAELNDQTSSASESAPHRNTWGNAPSNKVKLVLMPIKKRTPEPAKPAATVNVGPNAAQQTIKPGSIEKSQR